MKGIGDYRYVAVLLPYDSRLKIDEAAYRRFLQIFLNEPRFVREGGFCINPEAGEIFYLSRQEKRRVLEIAMEEAHGKVPIIAGTWAITTDETVETARDTKALRGRRDLRDAAWRRPGYHVVLGCRPISRDLARPNKGAGPCRRFADHHPSRRRRQAPVQSRASPGRDHAHL